MKTTYIYGTAATGGSTIYSNTASTNALSPWVPINADPFPNGTTFAIAGASNRTIVAVGYSSTNCLRYTIAPSNTTNWVWFTPVLTGSTLPPFNGGQGNGVTFYTASGTNTLGYVACGYDSANTHTVIYSADGHTWTKPLNNPFGNGYGKAVSCNGVFWVAVGKGTSSIAYCSSYALAIDTWFLLSPKNDPFLNGKGCDIKWNGRYWLAGGEGPNTLASCNTNPAGNKWSPVWKPVANPFIGGVIQGLAWNGVYWVAVGFNYDFSAYKSICIATSKDGIKWTVNKTNPIYENGGLLSGIDWQANAQKWVAAGLTDDGTITAICSNTSDPTGTWSALNNPSNPLAYGYGTICTITSISPSVFRLIDTDESSLVEPTTDTELSLAEPILPNEPIKEEPVLPNDPIKEEPIVNPFITSPPTTDDYKAIQNIHTLDFDIVDKWTNLNQEYKPNAYFGVISSNDIAKFWITGLDYFKTQLNEDCSGFKLDFGTNSPIDLVQEGSYHTAVVDLKSVGDTTIGFTKKVQYSIRVRGLTIYTYNSEKTEPIFINKSYNEIVLSSCLLLGTLVKTVGGWIPIETLRVHDTVMNHKGQLVKIVKILRMAEKYERNPKIKNKVMYKIPINSNGALKTVYISRHHRIMMEDGTFVKAYEANLKMAAKSEIANKSGIYYLYNLQLEDHTQNHLVINGGTVVECWDGVMETPIYVSQLTQSNNKIRFLRKSPFDQV